MRPFPFTFMADSYDPDALAGIAAVEATGASLTAAQKAAANTLIVGMKAQGIWSGTDCLWMFMGGTAAAHAVNWRQPGTYDMTWYNSPTHSANGVQFGGTAHGRTGYNPTTVGVNPADSGQFAYINSVGSGNRPLLAAQSDPATKEQLLMHGSGNEIICQQGGYAGRGGTYGTLSANGCVAAQRNSTTEQRIFINGTKTTVSTSSAGTTPVNLAMYLGCYNYGGSPALYSNARLALSGLYRGAWSDVSHTVFSSLVNALQTALSRA